RGRRHRGLALPAALQRPDGPVLPGPQAHPLVTRRSARSLLLAAAAALLAAACTRLAYMNASLAYENAAPMLAWMIDDYVDLTPAQGDWVQARLDDAMAWHRSRELPGYARFLASVGERSGRPF